MLTQIDVNSENAFYVPILGVTPKDSLLIRKVTGLNPPDINLFIGDYARDGGTYQGRRVGNRNVVITFDLNPNPALGETITGLRDLLYKAFVDPQVDADYIKLTLHDDDGRTRYLVGYTEKFETEIFDVDTMAQISIICPDPYLRDNTQTVVADPSGWTTVPFAYSGTAETGFEAVIYVTAPTSVVTLDNNDKTMVINYTFVAGDLIYINTIRGSRQLSKATAPGAWSSSTAYILNDAVFYSGNYYVSLGLAGNTNKQPDTNPSYWKLANMADVFAALTARGATTSIIGSLSSASAWLELHSQANVMKVYGATSSTLVAAVRTLKYTQAYWGI